MKRLLVVSIILIFTAGCYITPSFESQQILSESEITDRDCNPEHFRSVVLQGDTNAKLINGPYGVKNTGGHNIHIEDQILYIDTKPNSNGSTVKIFAPELNNVTVTDNASVTAKKFKATGLNIFAEGNGTVNLDGQITVNKIYQHGNGRINIIWVDSCNLFVESTSDGPIYLAGTANNMITKLSNDASFDARSLRTQNAAVFTTDEARADIFVVNTLKAYAVDESNIYYYYKRPNKLTVVTKDSGNVLRL